MTATVTAETLTDEMVRELLHEYLYTKPIPDSYGVDVCDEALGRHGRYRQYDAACTPGTAEIHAARTRIAAILNAREKEK